MCDALLLRQNPGSENFIPSRSSALLKSAWLNAGTSLNTDCLISKKRSTEVAVKSDSFSNLVSLKIAAAENLQPRNQALPKNRERVNTPSSSKEVPANLAHPQKVASSKSTMLAKLVRANHAACLNVVLLNTTMFANLVLLKPAKPWKTE